MKVDRFHSIYLSHYVIWLKQNYLIASQWQLIIGNQTLALQGSVYPIAIEYLIVLVDRTNY